MMWIRMAAVAVLVAAGASGAPAEDGGNPFRLVCDGGYLTGFEGRVGAWIDKVTIYCARWSDIQLDVSSSMGPVGFAGWSGGGNPVDASCPRGSLIAGPWSTRYTRDDDNLVLHSIWFNCRAAFDNPEVTPGKFGSDFKLKRRPGDDLFKDTNGECPEGEVATGIEGRSGLYVDLLRIVCGPAPKYNNTRVTDAGRKGGDNVLVGGELKLKNGGPVADPRPPAPPAPPTPQVEMAETTADTDVYRRVVTKDDKVTFVRTDDDPSHFLPKNFVAPVLAKETGWWKLELKNIAFAPGGEGWVAADQLKMK